MHSFIKALKSPQQEKAVLLSMEQAKEFSKTLLKTVELMVHIMLGTEESEYLLAQKMKKSLTVIY